MIMFAFCEIMTKKYAPAIRSIVANKLYREHKRNEIEVGKLMGITQSALSHYINLRRGSGMIPILLSEPSIMKAINVFADAINDELNDDIILDKYCEIYRVIRRTVHKEKMCNLAPPSSANRNLITSRGRRS